MILYIKNFIFILLEKYLQSYTPISIKVLELYPPIILSKDNIKQKWTYSIKITHGIRGRDQNLNKPDQRALITRIDTKFGSFSYYSL